MVFHQKNTHFNYRLILRTKRLIKTTIFLCGQEEFFNEKELSTLNTLTSLNQPDSVIYGQ